MKLNKIYFLAIPVVIGIIAGFAISSFENDENSEILMTSNNLMKDGSPVLGDSNAPITILEWGDYQCTFCYRFHQSSLQILLEEYVDQGKVNSRELHRVLQAAYRGS